MSGTSGSRVLSAEFMLTVETLMSSWGEGTEEYWDREEAALRRLLAPRVTAMRAKLDGLKQAGLELASMVDFSNAHEFKLSSKAGFDGRGDLEVGFTCRTVKPVTDRFANKISEAFEEMRTSGGKAAPAELVRVQYRVFQEAPFDLFAGAIVDGAEKEIEPALQARFDTAVKEIVKALTAEKPVEFIRRDGRSRPSDCSIDVERGWLYVKVLANAKDYQAASAKVAAVVDRALGQA